MEETATFKDKKVRFGTTVSISKTGQLASCANLEWTSRTKKVLTDIKTLKMPGLQNYDFGKCYYKNESDSTPFSFLLENGGVVNIFNRQFATKEGKR